VASEFVLGQASTEELESVAATQVSCRFCGVVLRHTFVDLVMSPLCETYLNVEQLHHGAILSTSRVHLREMFPGSTEGVRQSGGNLQ